MGREEAREGGGRGKTAVRRHAGDARRRVAQLALNAVKARPDDGVEDGFAVQLAKAQVEEAS